MTYLFFQPGLPASISPADSAELAVRLRALAQSGLPLEGGLRALAEEIGGRRLAGVLRRLAARLERGEPLETAIAAPDCRLPVVLRGLIVAGVRSGRLPQVLDQFAAMLRRRHVLRQRLIATFAYPAMLLSIVAVLLSFFPFYIVDEFRKLFADFGTRLPGLTEVYLKYAGVVAWTFLGLAVTAIVVPAVALLPLGGWLGRLSSWIPIVGPIVRQERYVQFSRLMATLLDAQTPLPEALELAAVAMRGTLLQSPCRAASGAVQAGIPLEEAVAGAGFLDSLTCLVAWGQKNKSLADAFRSAAESFEARSTSQTGLLNMILLPVIFVAIGGFVGISVVALFMPLISLVSNLSSGGRSVPPAAATIDAVPLYLACSVAAFLASVAALLATRRSARAEDGNRTSYPVRLVRVAAWTFVVASSLAIVVCLIALFVALLNGAPKAEDAVLPLAMLVSIGAYLLGTAILTVMPWFVGPSPVNSESPYASVVYVSAWTLTIAGFVLGILLFVPGLAIVALSIPAVIASMSYYKHAQTQQYAMLALIGAAAKRSMPLETAVAAFGHERGGWMRQRSRRIVNMLLDGVPLPSAVERAPGVVPPEAVPLFRVGCESGALPAAVDLAIEAHNVMEPVWQSVVPKVGYICLLPSVALGTVVFIMMAIVPQFQKIFKDFGVQLPPLTQAMIHFCAVVGHWWFLAAPVWMLTIALLFYCLLRYAGWIRWDLPGMDWLTRRRHTATILDGMSLAAGQQKPLARAVIELAAAYPQAKIVRRLFAAHDDMDAGGDDLETLYLHGLLGKTDLALLQAARRNGNLAWAARELADSNRRRMVYRANTFAQVVFPPIVVVYGIVVAMIAAALFLPLVKLISGLSSPL
jgi:type II secretory pathway component PulF